MGVTATCNGDFPRGASPPEKPPRASTLSEPRPGRVCVWGGTRGPGRQPPGPPQSPPARTGRTLPGELLTRLPTPELCPGSQVSKLRPGSNPARCSQAIQTVNIFKRMLKEGKENVPQRACGLQSLKLWKMLVPGWDPVPVHLPLSPRHGVRAEEPQGGPPAPPLQHTGSCLPLPCEAKSPSFPPSCPVVRAGSPPGRWGRR